MDYTTNKKLYDEKEISIKNADKISLERNGKTDKNETINLKFANDKIKIRKKNSISQSDFSFKIYYVLS